MPHRALIFVNGELPDPQAVRSMIEAQDWLIAADGGCNHLTRLGLKPDLLIGDLDSVDPAEVTRLRAAGVSIQQYPVEKDETDLELALQAALKAGCHSIRLVGALGGRLDQTLGNLFLLALPELAEVDIRLEDGVVEAFLIRTEAQIEGQAGDTVSMLPLGGPAWGVKTQGLRYPLDGETLYPEHTRGISNELKGEKASVNLTGGVLICIHTRGGNALKH